VIYVGIDWSERHHDVCVIEEAGQVLTKGRVRDGVEGLTRIHELLGAHAQDPSEIVVGIELDRGLVVTALVGAGYRVHHVNPLAVSRYRDRIGPARAKSDPGDAALLAGAVRTDLARHREIGTDTAEQTAIRALARVHQGLVWTRQREANQLRNLLRDYYPGAVEAFAGRLGSAEMVQVLSVAPTPAQGRSLSRAKIASALRRAGRTRRIEERAGEIQAALRAPQLEASPELTSALGHTTKALCTVIAELLRQTSAIEAELSSRFEVHPDAEILTSLPGLGRVLGARVLAEFGDDPNLFSDAKGRRAYAGTAPITKASGTRLVVLARAARNKRLADACYHWAFSALGSSPGARALYDRQRAAGKTHHQALRAVANRLVGILHGCLAHRTVYVEKVAWGEVLDPAA
jgi:transposase